MNEIILQFTDNELRMLQKQQRQCQFDDLKTLIMFQAEIAETLFALHQDGRQFYSGVKGKPETYEEVEFEFAPREDG